MLRRKKSQEVGKTKRMLEIKIPFKTPTVNHLYWHKGNVKIMKKDAKLMRQEIVKICEEQPISKIIPYENGLDVEVEVYEDWYCKNGSVKKKDVANREKFMMDSVFAGLGIDDKYIFKHTIIKKQSKQEYSIVRIGKHLNIDL